MASEGEVDAWLNWWQEIESGKRTYRFIGLDIEYGPDGPASVAAIQSNALNLQRDGERQSGSRRPTVQAITNSAVLIHQKRTATIGGIVLAAAVYA